MALTRVFMIRRNMEKIPQVDFPEGFGIRPMRVEEAPLWTDVRAGLRKCIWISVMGCFWSNSGATSSPCRRGVSSLSMKQVMPSGTISAWVLD